MITRHRRHSLPLAVALAVALGAAACFGPRWAAPPEGLAYAEPDPNPATYTFRESATFLIQAPGYGEVEVVSSRRGVAELGFRRAPEGFRVQVRFPELEARFRDATGETIVADADAIEGAVGVRLRYTGEMAVVDTPGISPRLLEISDLDGLVRPLFVRLPGRVVRGGERWVDTVTTREESAGTVSRSTTLVTSTLLGDTVVGGRRMLRIGTTAETELRVSGMTGGVEVEQELTGRLEGTILWDDAARVLVERVEEGELAGTLRMPSAGVAGMPVSARVRRSVSLRY